MSANIRPAESSEEQLPAGHLAPASHHEKFGERLTGIENTLTEILTCLKGNSEMGHRGIVARVADSEARCAVLQDKIDQVDRKLLRWGGLVTGAWLALSYLKTKVFG
jgi:hypothetical protein